MFIIELLGSGQREFVESYSNVDAGPRSTFSQRQAKPFLDDEEAEKWARFYLPGYNWRVIPCHSDNY